MDQELQTLMNQCREKKATAHQMAECARALGYPENHVIIKTAQQVWAEQNKLEAEYAAELKNYNAKLSRWRAECPYATEIYEKLRAHGLSHITASAIMGNIMAEVGGQTLENIDPYLRSGIYYGICMWNIFYCPKVNGRNLTGQVDYLLESMPKSMRQFGGSYDKFLSMTVVIQLVRRMLQKH